LSSESIFGEAKGTKVERKISAPRREKIGRGHPPKILSLDNITMKNLCLRRFLLKETQMYCAHLLNKIFTFGKENKLSLHSLTQIFCISGSAEDTFARQ
jgi:hypothetical protein